MVQHGSVPIDPPANDGHFPGEAVAQSQEKSQKWEYCYVSSPFTFGPPAVSALKFMSPRVARSL
jgi:hypothetical protein